MPVYPLRMAKVSYSMSRGRRLASIIQVDSIHCSCYLTPQFGPTAQRDPTWTSDNVLDRCTTFFVNSHLSLYFFQFCDGDFVLDADS